MKVFISVVMSCVILSASCDDLIKDTSVSGAAARSAPPPLARDLGQFAQTARNVIEEGRTFVHHAVKRMAFLMPAIFFKLGIAMTLLVLVTIVAVNNGVIGFMLLVVGLSSVLAKMQEARVSPPTTQYVLSPPQPHYSHFLDRSDTQPTTSTNSATYNKHYDYPQYTDVIYNTKYH